MVWHPDTAFKDYVAFNNAELQWDWQKELAGKPIFGQHEAMCLDKAMARCRYLCDQDKARKPKDVYELGMESLERAGRVAKSPDIAELVTAILAGWGFRARYEETPPRVEISANLNGSGVVWVCGRANQTWQCDLQTSTSQAAKTIDTRVPEGETDPLTIAHAIGMGIIGDTILGLC